MKNQKIRTAAKENGVKQWQIADKLGISEQTMARRMRYELGEEETERILSIITELAKENAA